MNVKINPLILSRIKLIFKSHQWAIILAIVAAVIIAYPQVWLRFDIKNTYQGIETIGASDDEAAWLSRVREAQDGHPSLSCVYLKDGKNDPYLFQPLGTIMVAYLGKIFSLDFNNTILLSRLFFSFVVFLIAYAFVFLFIKDKLIALASTTALFLASSLLSRWGIFQLLKGGSPENNFLLLTRPVNPLMTFFFFFGFLLFFWLFFDASTRFSARKQWIFGAISALFLGLSFYDYLYTCTFLCVFCGVLGTIFLLQKNWRELKRVVFVLLGAGLIAVPYFVNLYQATTYPFFQEIGARSGLVNNRMPDFGFLVFLLLFVFLLFFPKKPRDRYYFALALFITPFVVLNQQIITGKTLISAHYHWYFHTPLGVIFLLAIFFLMVARFRKIKTTAAALLILVSFYTGIIVQAFSYSIHKEKIVEEQRYGQVMNWLDKNAKKDEVVFSNDDIADFVIIYTSLNVFYHPSCMYCFSASKDRLLDAIFLYYRLNGVEKDDAREIFFRDRAKISGSIYGIHYRETTGSYAGIPDQIIFDLVQKYRDSFSLQTSDFLDNLWTKYEVKYLIWDKKNDPQWQLDQYSFLKKIAEIEDFVIYNRP